jgi:D-erythritol 1-phosphate dehydrogenase
VRLVKGSHIIVKKFWEGPNAYLFQNHDKRVIFVNPYEGDRALIGTTDIPYDGKAEDVTIGEDEISYLLKAVNRYSKTELQRSDVLHSFSGVRPLYDDNAANPSAVTRDYVFDVEGTPPLLSVFGGKITTYRKLAEHALQKLRPTFPEMGGDWTAKAGLPGGDMPNGFDAFRKNLTARHPWLPAEIAQHYARLYGSLSEKILNGAKSLADLGEHLGATLYRAEVDYLRSHEWAMSSDDILLRRTKSGLHMTDMEKKKLAALF